MGINQDEVLKVNERVHVILTSKCLLFNISIIFTQKLPLKTMVFKTLFLVDIIFLRRICLLFSWDCFV